MNETVEEHIFRTETFGSLPLDIVTLDLGVSITTAHHTDNLGGVKLYTAV